MDPAPPCTLCHKNPRHVDGYCEPCIDAHKCPRCDGYQDPRWTECHLVCEDCLDAVCQQMEAENQAVFYDLEIPEIEARIVEQIARELGSDALRVAAEEHRVNAARQRAAILGSAPN